MRTVFPAALLYWAIAFAVGFVLGTVRITVLAPAAGPLVAVGLELPLMLAASWLAAGYALHRKPLPAGAPRLAMGALAFAILLLAEAALARFAFGQAVTDWLASLTTAHGMLGLAGQVGFALIPALRR